MVDREVVLDGIELTLDEIIRYLLEHIEEAQHHQGVFTALVFAYSTISRDEAQSEFWAKGMLYELVGRYGSEWLRKAAKEAMED